MISARVSGLSAEVGSSSTMNAGSVASARAMAIRCWRPAPSWRGFTSRTAGSIPTIFISAVTRLRFSAGDKVVWRSSGSVRTCSTLQRGFMESVGSWKTICMALRNGVNSRCVRSLTVSSR